MTDTIARLNTALEGCYRIERELGAGGMATVYLACPLAHTATAGFCWMRRPTGWRARECSGTGAPWRQPGHEAALPQ